MDFVSFRFYVLLLIILAFYYLLPLKIRWISLLAGSFSFFYLATDSEKALAIFLVMIGLAYVMGLFFGALPKQKAARPWQKGLLLPAVFLLLLPLIITKNTPSILAFTGWERVPWVVPLGLSFFSLQMVAYVVDVYKGKIAPQRNPFKFALFIAFFPQLLQGPIPRYHQLSHQLLTGHRFQERTFVKGVQLIIWGFFLKLMLADKAAVVVNTIFDNVQTYRGGYVWVGGILYSIQLYTDFLSCVSIAMGVAALFGIELVHNFNHPYFSTSIKEFWNRWHISLSRWLRDYVYIPLGGNRKGTLRKYLNLILTFLVSGVWHGTGFRYVFWGLMHAFYQIAGSLTGGARAKCYDLLQLPKDHRLRLYLQRIGTCFWVMLAWIIFRANSLREGLFMLYSMFADFQPWIFFDNSLFQLGLSWREWGILLLSVIVLARVSMAQEKFCIRDRILAQPLWVRFFIYLAAILTILVFGTYGFGYNAQDFIYGGF